MTKRLTMHDWIAFGLATLIRSGFQALKADILARRLGVSRGSFYWHFADLETFHAQVIEYWRQVATEAVIADLDRYDSGEHRLDVLLRGALGHSALLELRMRAWADKSDRAARAVKAVDARRKAYIERLLEEADIPAALAATRAKLLYWAYLGAALSRDKLTDERLEPIVAELELMALGRRPGDPVTADNRQRRLPKRRMR